MNTLIGLLRVELRKQYPVADVDTADEDTLIAMLDSCEQTLEIVMIVENMNNYQAPTNPYLDITLENTMTLSAADTQFAYLNELAYNSVTNQAFGIHWTNKHLAEFLEMRFIEETHTVYYKDERGILRDKPQDTNDIMWMMVISSLMQQGHTSQTAVASLFLDWTNRRRVDKLDKESMEYKALYSLANSFVWELEKRGMIDNKTTLTNIGDMAAKVKMLTPEFAIKRAEEKEELQKAQPTKMRPLTNVPEDWKSNLVGIHKDCSIRLIPKNNKECAIPSTVLQGLNPIQRVGFVVSKEFRQLAQDALDNQEWVTEEELTEEDQRMLFDIVGLPDSVLFFVITLDKRGRFYYRGGLTTPQGNDFCKAAFQFSRKVALGEHGKDAVCVSLANALGRDKLSIEGRVKFARNLHLGHDIESLSESFPGAEIFQAWVAYKELIAIRDWSKEGKLVADFESSLVCHRDGTCNGIQHMAAITKDGNTAKLVNITGSTELDIPEDLYKAISDHVEKNVQGEDLVVIRELGRELTKGAVMVAGYGAGKDTQGAAVTKAYPAASNVLIGAILSAIRSEAKAITKLTGAIKSRFKDAVSAAAQADTTMELVWHTPDGFEVRIDYRDTESFTLRHHDKEGYSARIGRYSDAPMDPIKTLGAIAPNFIHSLDACHLRMVVRECAESDIELVTIHDSIGCHAGNAKEVDETIRSQFIKLHETSMDSLAELVSNVGKELPNFKGGYDLSDAMNARYMFS